MKKPISILLSLALLAVGLTACTTAPASSAQTTVSSTVATAEPTPEATAEPAVSDAPSTLPETTSAEIRLAGLKGATTMGMVQLLAQNEAGISQNKYAFTMATAADEITPKLVKGDLDIAAVPANLASVLYANTKGSVRLLAVNTLGVLYLCETGDTVKTLADLKGKTIYATGKGATPEYTLKHLLTKNGLDPETDVTIEWKSEPTEIVALLQKNSDAIAMLPQPFVTVALGQVDGLRIAVNLGAEWDKLGNGPLVTGVVIARTDFITENPAAVERFLDEYEDSIEWVNENPAAAAVLIEKNGIIKAPVAEKALPLCNITYLDGDEMKTAVSAYLTTLHTQNPKAVGGALPNADFYYDD